MLGIPLWNEPSVYRNLMWDFLVAGFVPINQAHSWRAETPRHFCCGRTCFSHHKHRYAHAQQGFVLAYLARATAAFHYPVFVGRTAHDDLEPELPQIIELIWLGMTDSGIALETYTGDDAAVT